MKCSYCEKEYFDQSQQICEYCGGELIKVQPVQPVSAGRKFDQFLEDSGLKGFFKKVKENLKNI